MRKARVMPRTTITINKSYQGEPLEWKINRMMTTNEPIDAVSPMLYTEREEGVKPEYNIRTDRFEVARETTDAAHKKDIAKRMANKEKKTEPKGENGGDFGKPETTQATSAITE